MDLSALGQQFGLSPQQTEAAMKALTPMVTAGMQRNASSGGGLGDILAGLKGGDLSGMMQPEKATSRQ